MNGPCCRKTTHFIQNFALKDQCLKAPHIDFQPTFQEIVMIARVLATLALTFASISAFAQYGTFGYDNNTRQWVPPGVAVNQQSSSPVFAAPAVGSAILAAQPAQVRGIPANCEIIRKDIWERIGNGATEAVIKGIGLGLLGVAADRIGRTGGKWTNVGLTGGAAVGFLEGSADKYTMVCHNHSNQHSNQSSGTASAPQGTGGHMCFIEGVKEAFPVKDPSTCSDIAGRMAKAKVGAPSSQEAAPAEEKPAVFTPVAKGRPAQINKTCHYEASDGTYRFNAISGTKIGPSECNAIIRGQREVPSVSNLSLIL